MGTLYLVSTPIGNLKDVTIRAQETLVSVDYIVCEDTRRTGLLLQELRNRYSSNEVRSQTDSSRMTSNNITPTLISFYEEVEQNRTPEIIELLQSDKSVALVSDAGTPLVSDPGFLLVREAIKREISVIPIPGASASLAALIASGLPVQPHTFLGFAPEKDSGMRKLFTNVLIANKSLESTYILYVAPHKLSQTMRIMQEILSDVSIVVARELTKVHEEFFRGTISEALDYFKNPKGEFVILFRL